MIPLLLRPMRSTDEGFIIDTWSKSCADELNIDRNDDAAVRAFKRTIRPTLARLLAENYTVVAVARKDPDAVQPGSIFGWICGSSQALHFVYVLKFWRGQGVARQLAEFLYDDGLYDSYPSKATHYTSWGFPVVQKLIPGIDFDPMLLAPAKG